jgi:peptidoglycan/xylan/chitin deacetylase (PgdA/CDA1 family)
MSDGDAAPRRFVITVDDPGGLIQDLGIFQNTLDFFAREEVVATYFVVPQSGDGEWRVDQSREWKEALRHAGERGHDFQLHGLDHGHCEFGAHPELMCLMGRADYEARLKADIEQFGHLWRRELFVESLERAVGIFENAVGRKPLAFRTGALSQSPQLYKALPDVGIGYVSNRVIDPRGWHYIGGNYENCGDWEPEVPPQPYRLTDEVVDLPISSEYAWQVPDDRIEQHVALAVEDMRRIYDLCDVFLLVCHVQEVGGESPNPQRVLRQILKAAREEYQVKFITLRELVADIESGAVPVITPERRQSHGGYYNGS